MKRQKSMKREREGIAVPYDIYSMKTEQEIDLDLEDETEESFRERERCIPTVYGSDISSVIYQICKG